MRPKAEYASSIWDPSTQKDIDKLEMIQWRAARYVTGRYSPYDSPSDMISNLGWPSLQQRRAESRLSMFHKIVNNKVDIVKDRYLSPNTRPSRQGNTTRFCKIPAKKDTLKYSYFPRTIEQWNSLSGTVVDSGYDTFKSIV